MSSHGTLYCYNQGCRHPDCRTAKTAYERNRIRQIAYGRWQPYVDAEPVRQHVKWLISEGVPANKLTPIYPTVCVLLYGRPKRGTAPTAKMRREAAEALLAVQPTLDMLGPHARIDAAGTHRRIQGLCALGWSMTAQAARMGSAVYRLRQVLSEDTVTAKFSLKVRALYDEVSMVRPAGGFTDRTRRWAAAQGWLPPLAWDDDLIDLPDADLAVELSRRAAAMDAGELYRAYRAHLDGDRSPLIVAGAEAYLAARRTGRRKDSPHQTANAA